MPIFLCAIITSMNSNERNLVNEESREIGVGEVESELTMI